MLPPLSDLHRIECWLLHHGLHLKAILRPALPRHGLLYERSALLTSATEESKMALPRGLAPRTSAFAGRHARFCYTSGANIPGRSRTCVASFGNSHSFC